MSVLLASQWCMELCGDDKKLFFHFLKRFKRYIRNGLVHSVLGGLSHNPTTPISLAESHTIHRVEKGSRGRQRRDKLHSFRERDTDEWRSSREHGQKTQNHSEIKRRRMSSGNCTWSVMILIVIVILRELVHRFFRTITIIL